MVSYIQKDRLNRIRNDIKTYYCQSPSKNDRILTNIKKSVFGDEMEHRNEFRRDKDRIIFSKAFRRLQHKAQVYSNEKGDHYRTRLTHTLETSQIARGISNNLCLNEDLTEAIALGHDIGHTPFGHEGENILDKILRGEDLGIISDFYKIDYGGFKHNFNSIKILDLLEERYENQNGLNLTWQVLDGILKHTKIVKNGKKYDLSRFVKETSFLKPYIYTPKEEIHFPVTLEGQIVSVADEIAQRQHDLDDGLRDAELKIDDVIKTIEDNIVKILNSQLKIILFAHWNRKSRREKIIQKIETHCESLSNSNSEYYSIIEEILNDIPESEKIPKEELRLLLELKFRLKILFISKNDNKKTQNLIRYITSYFIHDITLTTLLNIEKSQKKIARNKSKAPYVIFGGKRHLKEVLVHYSETGMELDKKIRHFIENRIINSFNVNRFDGKSNYIIRKLFEAYYTNPKQMKKENLTYLNNLIKLNCNTYYDIKFINGQKLSEICFSPDPEKDLNLGNINELIKTLKFDKINFEDLQVPDEFDEEIFFNGEDLTFWNDKLIKSGKKDIIRISNEHLLEKNLFLKCLLENRYALLSTICDYIAGMTDNYAKKEYAELYLV